MATYSLPGRMLFWLKKDTGDLSHVLFRLIILGGEGCREEERDFMCRERCLGSRGMSANCSSDSDPSLIRLNFLFEIDKKFYLNIQ